MFEFDVWREEHFAEPERFRGGGPVMVSLDMGRGVGELARHDPLCVDPTLSARQAAALFARTRTRAALVVSNDILLGVLTRGELVGVVDRVTMGGAHVREPSVRDVMRVGAPTFVEEDSIGYVLQKARASGHETFALVDDDGAPVGILETEDLLAWLAEQVLDGAGSRWRVGATRESFA